MEASNMQAMREALSKFCAYSAVVLNAGMFNEEHLKALLNMAKAALAAPPRNCDALTVEEQVARFESYCKSYYESHHQDCRGCKFYDPMHMGLMCLARWEQDSCDETQEKNDPAHSTDHGELIAGEPR